jgi:hypothetical protein
MALFSSRRFGSFAENVVSSQRRLGQVQTGTVYELSDMQERISHDPLSGTFRFAGDEEEACFTPKYNVNRRGGESVNYKCIFMCCWMRQFP